jgi:GTP-binding protein EngB required for normal cell division
MREVTTFPRSDAQARDTLRAIAEICGRHRITALDDFQHSCRAFADEQTLNVAILGRFKAGKSSFLNRLLGRPLLPVGAIPVTAVVTEIEYGPCELAEVVFKNGSAEQLAAHRIGEFISERENPQNCKHAVRVRVQLPEMDHYRRIRFVDTPGLESVLEHNTEASLEWLPNVGLALVAVGVDPPLSQHDIELIRNLGRYTPNISLLLTKVDLLNDREAAEVQEFVRTQLQRYWDRPVPVFPFSIRPGFEHLQAAIDQELLSRASEEAGAQRAAILRHKIDSLLSECACYLTVALKAAEAGDSERQHLRQNILGETEYLDDARLALRFIARRAAAASRTTFERLLKPDEQPLRDRLLAELDRQFPSWIDSLATAAARFAAWLSDSANAEIESLSAKHREEFVQPVGRVSRQLSQSLQDFRNRLSERVLQALGAPLPTYQTELRVEDPRSPDVRVGKIFDRNWELLSPLLPVFLVRSLLKKHLERKTADVVWINLSRLASQWEEIVNASLTALEKDAMLRLDSLISTIEQLAASGGDEAPVIRADLLRIAELRDSLEPRG